jgi:NADH pyrophosphatase NudC (nudix superfamily)
MYFCSHCGEKVNIIYEDEFKRYICASCNSIYYENPKPCVIAFIIHDDKLLLSRRIIDPGKNKWDFIGGFLEKDEHPEQGLKREVREEIAVDLAEFRYFGIYMDKYGDEKFSTLNIVYICELAGDPRINSREFDQLRWFEFSELPNEYAFESMYKIIDDYKRYQKI